MQPNPEQIRRGPAAADHRLVLLHGWGADAGDLIDLGALLVGPEVSVVALQAPLAHPGGGGGRQWYDLQEPEWPQLPAARQHLVERLWQLDADVPLRSTVLLGFSQGAAMGLDVATGELAAVAPLGLAGLISCSGYPHPDWQPRPATAGSSLPILLTHGKQDPVVPYAASEELGRRLSQAGHQVDLLGFSGGHSIDDAVLPSLRAFLARVLAC